MIKKTPLESWILKKIDYRGTPELGRKAIYHYQLKKLRAIIAFVKSKSIFYKNHLAHISEQQIDSFEDFAKVPFTTEEDIRVNPLHFICESQGNMSRVVSLNTSGTTGNPKRIYFTEEDQGLTIDFFNIGMSTLVKQGDKVLILMPGEQPGTVGDLLKKGLKRMNIEAFIHGPVYDVEKTIEVMIRNNINCLVGIPVQVLELCRYKEKNVSLNIDNVLLSTDYVSDAIIKELKTHWGCRVFCHYGMTEMGLGGGVQCEAFSGYHMREADLYFEIINPYTGMVVPEGEWGEVVFTTLTRKGMPLIRYRTGDISRFIPQSCPCNTVLKSMDKIQGRLEGITRIGNDKLLSIPEIDEEIFKVEGVTDYHLVINKNGEVDCLCFEIKSNEQQDEKYFEDFKTKIIHVLNNIPVIREGKLENKLEISVDLWKNVQASNGTSKRQIEDKRGERWMINIYEKILNILKTGESLVTATILDRAGSAPRDAGAKMIIKKDASIIGTIGGGMFEATAIQLAESVFKDQKQVIKRFVLTDKDASGLGMTCGGELEMFLEHIDGSKKEIINKYERIVQLAKNESKFVVMTELSDKIDYDKCVCTKEDIYETKKIYSIFKENQIDFNNLEFQIVEFEQKKYLIEPVSIFEYVYIFGAGHISQKLATVAKLVNFKIVVLDDRKEFASRERFPDADEIRVIDSFDKVSGDVSIDNQSYVVIVTRGHAKDKEVLAQMLKTDAKYIGMIGSKKKIKGIYDQLLEEGFTEKDLERVYSPIGIDIQAETPEEIAISIVAELIQIRREEKDEK